MKILKNAILFGIVSLLFTNCFEDRDDNAISSASINDFIWKGLNTYYLYKVNVPDLYDDRFTSDSEYSNFLNSIPAPEEFFENLIHQRTTVDKYSWIVSDYIALEQLFSGTTVSNGMEYGIVRYNSSSDNVFAYIRYISPSTSAEAEGLQRGQFFNAVDGIQLTLQNWRTLLNPNTYTINLATYNTNGTPETNDDSIDPSDESITLTKMPYTEDPIFKSEVFDIAGENVGYLMYNGFTANFDDELNAVFSNFVANNIQHLVLDLRYNPGGSVNTAILLSSMISGLNGEVFSKEQWNDDIQAVLDPETLINRFTNNDEGTLLSTINLDQLYVLTSESSASASELVINCLDPYIDVVQIGTKTTGKTQASVTLYDSPDFRRQNANPNHTYAMQPLIFKSLNSQDFGDYEDGLMPDTEFPEQLNNLGVLGDINEPLLQEALMQIENTKQHISTIKKPLLLEADSKDLVPFSKEMYINR